MTDHKSKVTAALFARHGQSVYQRALQLLGNAADAEDATQEVFARAWDHADRLDDSRSELAWLSRVTTNYCLNVIRDRQRRLRLVSENLGPHGDGRELVGGAPEERIQIRRLLASVDERQAQAALCVLGDGMSHAEAAEVLGVSRRTIGNLLERFHAVVSQQEQKEAADQGRCSSPSLARAIAA